MGGFGPRRPWEPFLTCQPRPTQGQQQRCVDPNMPPLLPMPADPETWSYWDLGQDLPCSAQSPLREAGPEVTDTRAGPPTSFRSRSPQSSCWVPRWSWQVGERPLPERKVSEQAGAGCGARGQ